MAIRDIRNSGSNLVRKEPTEIHGIYRLVPDNSKMRGSEVDAEVRKLLKEKLSEAKYEFIETIIDNAD